MIILLLFFFIALIYIFVNIYTSDTSCMKHHNKSTVIKIIYMCVFFVL